MDFETGVEQSAHQLAPAAGHDGREHTTAPGKCRLGPFGHDSHDLVVLALPHQIVRIEEAAMRSSSFRISGVFAA